MAVTSATSQRRFLHYVFKIGDRNEMMRFCRSVLRMKVLRHEEFHEACKATCNGPYDGKWSKTMVGFGPEDKYFALELTYNYGIKSYQPGNDFIGIVFRSNDAVCNAANQGFYAAEIDKFKCIKAPGGYRFLVEDIPPRENIDPLRRVIMACSDLKCTLDYWHGLLGMTIYEKGENYAVLGYGDNQCKLEFQDIGMPVLREEAFGRLAFSCPTEELSTIENKIKEAKHKVLTPLVSLDTPGKATVQVVILSDPDEHEICFVGEEGFHELSKVDPKAGELLDEALKADKSDEYFAKKEKKTVEYFAKKEKKSDEYFAKKEKKSDECVAKKEKSDECVAKKEKKSDECVAKKEKKCNECAAKKEKKSDECAAKKEKKSDK